MVDFTSTWMDERTSRAERRQVTVLSCELVTTAEADPESLSSQLDHYRAAVATIVDRHGGRIIADISGSILAIWGDGDQPHGRSATPVAAGPKAPRSAVMAALDLAAVDLAARQCPAARLRIGLDAGIVIVNHITSGHITSGVARPFPGSLGEFVGPVLAEARGLGARSGEDSVVVSDTVRQLTLDAFVFAPHEPATVSARPTWSVTACRSAIHQFDRRAPDLVGNARQRALLDQALTAVLTRERRIMVITGEAGIGKSTLFRHFRARVNASKARWIEAICRPEDAHATLQPIRDLLRQGLASADIAALCEPALPTQSGPVIADLDDADRQLLGRFFHADSRVPSRHLASTEQTCGKVWPSDRQQRLVTLLIEMLHFVIARQPTMLAIEDLHWADTQTLELLSLLVDRSARWPKFGLLLVTRRDDQLPRRVTLRSTVVAVERLSHAEIEDMLARQTRSQLGSQNQSQVRGQPDQPTTPPLTPQILSRIAHRADGVPLFAEQLAALYRNTSDPEQASAILAQPTSLNLTLAARLDALDDSKALAQAASVLGRDFHVNVLAPMLAMPPEQLAPHLALLVASGLVTHVSDRLDVSHRFSHALIRDAAYASMLKQQRRWLHRRAAEALQAMPPLANANPEAMALHFTEADEGTAAARWWRLAAQRALGFSHLKVAVAHLQRGLALVTPPETETGGPECQDDAARQAEELAIRQTLGPCLTMLAGNGADAVIANYRRCLELTSTAGPSSFEVLWGLQGCHSVRGELREALAIGEQAILAAEATRLSRGGDEQGLLAHRMQGLSRLQAGDIALAIDHYREVERRYIPAKHENMRFRYASDQGVLATTHWAWAEAVAGNLAASEQLAEQALARAGQLEHPHTSAHVLSVLAARAQTLRQREVAAPLALAARTLAYAHGFTYWSAWSEIILGWHEGATAPDASITRIERAIQDYRRTGAGQALPFAMLLKAEVALNAGLTDLAARTTADGLELAQSGGLGLYVGELQRVRALALMQTKGAGPDVLRSRPQLLLRTALDLSLKNGARIFAMRAAVALLRCHRDGPVVGDGVALADDREAAINQLRQLLADLCGPPVRPPRPVSAEIADALAILANSSNYS